MTLFEQTIQTFENQDYDCAKRIHHEEFMFVREYSMSSREEHLANIQEWFAGSTSHKRVECVHEDDFVLVMRASEIDDSGRQFVSNNMSIKQNGLYWQTIVKTDYEPHAHTSNNITHDACDAGRGG